MKLISLTIARNEAWTLGPAIRAALRWNDAAVIMDHASTDRTPEVIAALSREYPGRVHALREDDPIWHEQNYRQKTLHFARELGASHMSIVDADEMLTENLVPRVRGIAESLEPGQLLQPAWLCLWRSMSQFREDNSIWSHAWVSWIFRDAPHLHWSPRDIGGVKGYDLHCRAPHGSREVRTIPRSEGGVLHYQHASWERLRWKQVLYRMVEWLRWPEFGMDSINTRYGPTSNEDGMQLKQVPAEWLPPEIADVRADDEPWQKTECRRLIALHGRDHFAGLDFLGLDV